MVSTSGNSQGNRLLQTLSADDRDLIERRCSPVELPLRLDLEKPNQHIEHVYFPHTGIASVVALHPTGTRVEIGLIGCEGMTGIPVLLGTERSPHSTYIQLPGRGWRIATGDLHKAMQTSPSLHAVLLRYVQSFMVQTSHTAIANARATLPERLARWLLMAHDRVPRDELALTHEFISLMMGVRRAGVTEALHELVERKLITASRGEITILDRKGIEQLAGHFYGAPEAEYRRLLG